MFIKNCEYYINIDVYIELFNNNNKRRGRRKKLYIVGSNVHPMSLKSQQTMLISEYLDQQLIIIYSGQIYTDGYKLSRS